MKNLVLNFQAFQLNENIFIDIHKKNENYWLNKIKYLPFII